MARSAEQRMQLRLLHSASLAAETGMPSRPLDKAMVNKSVEKVDAALELGPEWEARMRSIKDAKKKKKVRTMISQVNSSIIYPSMFYRGKTHLLFITW